MSSRSQYFLCRDRLALGMEWHMWPIEGSMLTRFHALFIELCTFVMQILPSLLLKYASYGSADVEQS